MTQAIQLHDKTRERLENLIRSQQEAQRLIDVIVATARESLDVPDDWTIGDVRVGFVGPVDQPPA
jgi:hypothetical protein